MNYAETLESYLVPTREGFIGGALKTLGVVVGIPVLITAIQLSSFVII